MLLSSLRLLGGLRLRRNETEMLLSPLGLGNPANEMLLSFLGPRLCSRTVRASVL